MNLANNKSYCSLLWKHVCVRPNSSLRPCCIFEADDSEFPNFDEQLSALNHNTFKTIRQQMLDNQKIKGCEKCYEQEDNNLLSLRNLSNKNLSPLLGDEKTTIDFNSIESVELFLGDLCNLKCVMCSPRLSTKWREDYKLLGWPLEERPQQNQYTEFLSKLPRLKEVKFVGGEPMLHKDHFDLIENLARQADKTTLEYSTNATCFVEDKIFEKWLNFKKVKIFLSIDGTDLTNEYIRYPSKWCEIEKITIEYLSRTLGQDKFEINILCTVSLFNIFKLNDLYNWFEGLKNKFPHSQLKDLIFVPLSSPIYMSINEMPMAFKIKAIQSLPKKHWAYESLKSWLSFDSQTMYPNIKFTSYIESIDRARRINVLDYIPELSELINHNRPETHKRSTDPV